MSTKKMFSGAVIALSLIVFISMLSSCGAAVEKLLDQMVVEGNKQYPMQIDSETRLDRIAHPEKGVLEYLYTVNISKKDLDASPVSIDDIVSMMKTMSVTTLKNTTDKALKAIINFGTVTFRHTYYDKDGELLFSFDVTPEDYK
ncbi:MAG: hypothetical protein LBI82_09230 [Dysgonamonadaceae bacterium]|jgi:hypothetical protein|nr:hypothetical protein [Dysgonamonadaceae bacterium]